MDFKDLVTLYFERSNAMQTFWNFYITIILALLAFFGTVKFSRETKIWAAALLSVAFAAFATVNLAALRDTNGQRNLAASLIHEHALACRSPLELRIDAATKPPKEWMVMAMHLTGDTITLAGIWVLTLKREGQAVTTSGHRP